MIDFHLAVISSSASSQVIALNWPDPLGPVRLSGVLMRSGELTRSASRLTFPQADPAVYGCSGSPCTRTILPSSTWAISEHMSGQSCAQTTRTWAFTTPSPQKWKTECNRGPEEAPPYFFLAAPLAGVASGLAAPRLVAAPTAPAQKAGSD